MPILWGNILKNGEVPGTWDWFSSMDLLYMSTYNPCSGYNSGYNETTRAEQISGILTIITSAAEPGTDVCDSSLYNKLLLSIWPDLFDEEEEDAAVDDNTPAQLEKLQRLMGNLEDFVHVKKEYRQKKFFGINFRYRVDR